MPPPPLSVLLIAITLVVAGLIGIFILRRRATARTARIRAANAERELYQAAVALRLRAASSGRLARPGDPDADDPPADDGVVPAAPAVADETASAAAIVATSRISKVAGPAASLELSVRRRLWRDSAGVLLAGSLVVMAATTFDPGPGSASGPVVTAAPEPTPEPTPEPAPEPTPAPASSRSSALARQSVAASRSGWTV